MPRGGVSEQRGVWPRRLTAASPCGHGGQPATRGVVCVTPWTRRAASLVLAGKIQRFPSAGAGREEAAARGHRDTGCTAPRTPQPGAAGRWRRRGISSMYRVLPGVTRTFFPKFVRGCPGAHWAPSGAGGRGLPVTVVPSFLQEGLGGSRVRRVIITEAFGAETPTGPAGRAAPGGSLEGQGPSRRQGQACGLRVGRPRLQVGPSPSLGTGWLGGWPGRDTRPQTAERGGLGEHSLGAEGRGRGRVGGAAAVPSKRPLPPGSAWALPSVTVPARDPRV